MADVPTLTFCVAVQPFYRRVRLSRQQLLERAKKKEKEKMERESKTHPEEVMTDFWINNWENFQKRWNGFVSNWEITDFLSLFLFWSFVSSRLFLLRCSGKLLQSVDVYLDVTFHRVWRNSSQSNESSRLNIEVKGRKLKD